MLPLFLCAPRGELARAGTSVFRQDFPLHQGWHGLSGQRPGVAVAAIAIPLFFCLPRNDAGLSSHFRVNSLKPMW